MISDLADCESYLYHLRSVQKYSQRNCYREDKKMRQEYMDDEGGKVCYWIAEEIDPARATLFFLHGLTADHTMFEKQISLFKRFYNILIAGRLDLLEATPM